MANYQRNGFLDIIDTYDSPVIIFGDYNTNLLGRSPSLPPRICQLLGWTITLEVCFLNKDTLTSLAPNGTASLLDLTLLIRSFRKHIQFLIHPDSFDSDHHPICISLLK